MVENIILDFYTLDVIQYINGHEPSKLLITTWNEQHPNEPIPDRKIWGEKFLERINAKNKKNWTKNLMHVPYRREVVIL